MGAYAELQVTTNFSFLRGASHAEELFTRAAELGLPALGVCDRHSLAGVVRAHEAARASGVGLVVGCRLDLADGFSVLVYPEDRPAYARLCRLLTLGKGRAGKGGCRLAFADLADHAGGMTAILLPDAPDAALAARLGPFAEVFGEGAHLALTLRRRPGDAERIEALVAMARAAGVAPVATNDVLYHDPRRRILQDVLTAIREHVVIDEAGFRKTRFADRHLKPPGEMARLFARHPEAVERSMEIVRRCRFSLEDLRYQYPNEVSTAGVTPQQDLVRLTWEGAAQRYPQGVPAKTRRLLLHELALVEKLGYAPYFLTVNAIVRFARSRGILCQGRGSAANSAVCYVLGITSIDPERSNLLFERFVSEARKEPPDIDVDFEHERREEVIQWIYETYGRERAALTATVIRYRARGALRDVGKAMGLPEDVVAALSSRVWGWSREGVPETAVAEAGLDATDRRLRLTLQLTAELIGFPRHLSQHPGGFVLTDDRLDELVPIEPAAMADRQIIEWDKDDIDVLKFMKVDVLGLGMLGCMRRAFDLLAREKGIVHDLASVPAEDQATYAMIRKADTLGVFQIESRAQMAMLPRLKPRTFYDLVIEVAIVRPGPIQGDMVHPYLRRREGREKVEYPTEELKAVLGKTLGVPLFQEQAMQVAITCAGFTPVEADQLRRSMATFKNFGTVSAFRDKLIEGMAARGYERDFAERTFRQLEGFGSYGFPESHAASFALIAYASCWMKCHHPDVFCAALLNAQPMGFYAPAQIVRDAREHGVEVRPVDVNASRWDTVPEPPADPATGRLALRLGFRMVKGLANAEAARIVAARAGGDEEEDGDGAAGAEDDAPTGAEIGADRDGAEVPFSSVEELWRRSGVPVAALEKLAAADAFLPSMGLSRRDALWAIKALKDEPLPLFAAADRGAARAEIVEPPVAMKPMAAGRLVVEDYASTGLTLRRHPVSFLRADLSARRIRPAADLLSARDGAWLATAGLVLVRQKPGSAKGVMFITLEDETGIANLVVWPKLFERQRGIVLGASMIAADGRVQREGEVIHLVVQRLHDLTRLLQDLGRREGPGAGVAGRGAESGSAAVPEGEGAEEPRFPLPHGRGDEFHHGGPGVDPRGAPKRGWPARDLYEPDRHIDRFRQQTRDFR